MTRTVEVRKTEPGSPSEAEFDREFWARVEPADRLAMVWELTLEYLAWRQPDAPEPRLQRSVCRVER